MVDIASATGVSRQTIYNHFGDKEGLFLAVADQALSATLDALRGSTIRPGRPASSSPWSPVPPGR